MNITEYVRRALSKALHLPDALAAVFDLAQARGQKGTFLRGEPFRSVCPPDEMNEAFQHFELPIPAHASDPGLAVPAFEDMTDPMRHWMDRVLPQ